jgi:hypothetical protein
MIIHVRNIGHWIDWLLLTVQMLEGFCSVWELCWMQSVRLILIREHSVTPYWETVHQEYTTKKKSGLQRKCALYTNMEKKRCIVLVWKVWCWTLFDWRWLSPGVLCHGTSQKTVIFILAVMRTWNLTSALKPVTLYWPASRSSALECKHLYV